MRFLIQIPQLIFAGAEKVLVCFANDLAARGHEVEILEVYEKGLLKPQFDRRVTFCAICSNAYTNRYYASLKEIRAEKRLLLKLEKAGKLIFSKIVGYRRFAERLSARYYADKHYDVAINYLEIESPAFLLKYIHADKYLQWYHTDVANMDNPKATDAMVSEYVKMDAIICVAESAKRSFVTRYPQLKEKTTVIYNYFDAATIRRMAEEPFEYEATEEGCPILLSVGRMTPQKKYMRFLRVLARLRDEGYRFHWHVIGEGQDRVEVEKTVSALGLEPCVFIEGITDNPYKYMSRCDLFVLPSGWEGFPTVTVEAKILGCPVLATDVSGIREQIVHDETGWIVGNNENDIRDGLKYLLDHQDVRERLRSNHGFEIICNNDIKYDRLLSVIRN